MFLINSTNCFMVLFEHNVEILRVTWTADKLKLFFIKLN
jgi:hypothetical protein